jgi:hypothetical protein
VEVLAPLLVIVALGLVVLVVGAPLRRPAGEEEAVVSSRAAALETAKEAKYREIRDAELDLRTGKLTEAEHRAVDRQLRAEAVAILRELDELE